MNKKMRGPRVHLAEAGGHIMRIGHAASLFMMLVFVSGCVAPGSGIGSVGLIGNFNPMSGNPPQNVNVTLPATYGLGGLDQWFGEPEDYGHKERNLSAVISGGEFKAYFRVVYHVAYWLIPPLGPIPRQPPPPFFVLRFPDMPDEVYIVGLVDEQVEYKVFDASSREERGPQDSHWRIAGRGYEEANVAGEEIWYLQVSFVSNDNGPQSARDAESH